jgi:hypothetical protein
MEYKKFTKEELQDPKQRALFIYQMPPTMRIEILDMFKDMARGHSGGSVHSKPGETVRGRHYSAMSDSWFDQVLCAYKIIHTSNN